MSYTFLLDAGAESSAECFADIPASVLSRLSLTEGNHSCNASATAYCQDFQSGMTLPPSMVSRGVERLMQFAVDFRAKILAQPAKAQVLPDNEADCGLKCDASFAKWNPESFSWKTHQFSLAGGLESFSGTWPRWGSMRDGECYPLPMPSGLMELRAWITSESESGLSRLTTPVSDDTGLRKKEYAQGGTPLSLQVQRLPTLTKFDAAAGELIGKEYDGQTRHAMKLIHGIQRLQTVTKQDANGRDRHNQKDGSVILSLLGECRRLQTPVADDAVNRKAGKINSRGEPKLSAQVKRMPSATKSDGLGGPGRGKNRQGGDNLRTEVGGSLNPEWVEWFMGWPIGWTALQPLATAKFHKWLRSHGQSLAKSKE